MLFAFRNIGSDFSPYSRLAFLLHLDISAHLSLSPVVSLNSSSLVSRLHVFLLASPSTKSVNLAGFRRSDDACSGGDAERQKLNPAGGTFAELRGSAGSIMWRLTCWMGSVSAGRTRPPWTHRTSGSPRLPWTQRAEGRADLSTALISVIRTERRV